MYKSQKTNSYGPIAPNVRLISTETPFIIKFWYCNVNLEVEGSANKIDKCIGNHIVKLKWTVFAKFFRHTINILEKF